MLGIMSVPSGQRAPALTACALVTLVLGAGVDGRAQEPTVDRPSLRVGPTLEARAVTARSLLYHSTLDGPSVGLRYGAYERDFARAFGFPLTAAAYADSESFWTGLERWVNTRWGDSTVFGWVERGLLLYARVQANTQFENRGFNMDLDMEDVAEGKFGVRVSRALEPR